MSEHLVRKKHRGKNPYELKDFAEQVETALTAARGPRAMVNIAARLLTNKDPRIAALMMCKWVEWRYGKPKDPDSGPHSFAIQIINHIPRPGELAQIASESSSESNETSETKIIQAEPKSKQ